MLITFGIETTRFKTYDRVSPAFPVVSVAAKEETHNEEDEPTAASMLEYDERRRMKKLHSQTAKARRRSVEK